MFGLLCAQTLIYITRSNCSWSHLCIYLVLFRSLELMLNCHVLGDLSDIGYAKMLSKIFVQLAYRDMGYGLQLLRVPRVVW